MGSNGLSMNCVYSVLGKRRGLGWPMHSGAEGRRAAALNGLSAFAACSSYWRTMAEAIGRAA
jgi:hypothetical protein